MLLFSWIHFGREWVLFEMIVVLHIWRDILQLDLVLIY